MGGRDSILVVAIPLAGAAAYACAHFLLPRAQREAGSHHLVNLVAGGLFGLAVTAALVHLVVGTVGYDAEGLALAATTLLIYLSLAWCYFHFINIMVASLRLRILRETAEAPGGLSREEVLSRYDAAAVVAARLDRLVSGGHLVRRGERLVVGAPFFLILYDVFQMLKFAVLGRGNRMLAGVEGAGAGFFPAAADLARILWGNRFLRFLVVGGINTLFSYALFGVLILSGLDYRVTVTVLTAITILFNFTTTGRIVFGSRGVRPLGGFLAVYGIIYLVNLGGLYLLVDRGGLHPMAGQAILIPVIVVISYVLNRKWVFRKGADTSRWL